MEFGDSVSLSTGSNGILKVQIMTLNQEVVLPLFFEYTVLPMCDQYDDDD